jgi:gamma-glutamylcyclotransferase (GGCT)/AIG2-like uncharacterized protein YtfP
MDNNITRKTTLFVYGALKRFFCNHDRFCRGVLAVEDTLVRGRLFETSGPGSIDSVTLSQMPKITGQPLDNGSQTDIL